MRTQRTRTAGSKRGTASLKALHCLAALALCSLPPVLYPLSAGAAGFDSNSAGTATAQFLKIAPGARGVAMGEAFSALADDATAIDWNPAGLIKIKSHSLALMHSPYLAGTFVDFFAYSQRAGEVGCWGMSVKYMDYGKIVKTDTAGVEIGEFSPYDVSVAVGFATYITGFNKDPEDRFVLGATGKFIRSELLSSDSAVSSDIGVLLPYLFENRFLISMTVQNLMGTLRYDKFDYPLPLMLRLGSLTRVNDNMLVTADFVAPRDNAPFLAMGGEFRTGIGHDVDLFLRGGFNTRSITELGGLRNITMGTGFRYTIYSIDYSFSPFGDLGSVHRISAALNF